MDDLIELDDRELILELLHLIAEDLREELHSFRDFIKEMEIDVYT